jgi:putative transposase
MTRPRSLPAVHRDEGWLPRSQALKAEHPCWGSRRIWASVRCVEQLPVNKKRIWRLMRAHHLLVPPTLKRKAKRTRSGSKPKPTKPNPWWGIERTKVLVEGVGWGYIVIGLDWSTQGVVGHDAGLRCTTEPWREALDMAVNQQFPQGARGQGVALMSDHGAQPTSTAFMQACATLAIHQAFTSDHNPKGNADPERFMRTLTEACLWLQAWACPLELIHALKGWLTHDNEYDLHSTLGDQSPRQFERDDLNRHSPPFVAA